jgi:DNA-binding NarL/FixJ family response regulator
LAKRKLLLLTLAAAGGSSHGIAVARATDRRQINRRFLTCASLMTSRPRVLLADDHLMLLESFKRMLEPSCEVVGCVADGRALLATAPKLNPEIVVLDISMPQLNGIDACGKLRQIMPQVKFIFLTVNEDPDLAVEAFRLGASAYLLKSSAASELFSAIQNAREGRIYITPLITKGTPTAVFLSRQVNVASSKLTPRQREVLQLLAEGHGMKQAADILNVSVRTVAFHKYTMMEALGLKTSAELVQYAVQQHLVTLKPQGLPSVRLAATAHH